MARPFLSRLLSRRSPVRRSPPIARPRLSVLEDRLAPAVLDIDAGGVLSFTGANVASSPALSLSGGNFNFIDALDPITLGPGAIAAGYTVGSGGATATGPAAGVTALNFVFGTSPTAIFFGSFDALVPSIDVVSGTAAGSSLEISAPVESTGTFSASGFGSVMINGQLKGATGISFAADNVEISVPITSDGNRTIITTATAGRPINLGTENPGALSLTSLELDRISASVIQIGDAAVAGDITISAAIAPLNSMVLSLVNGPTRSVIESAAGSIAIPSLAVRTGTASIAPTNAIGTVAAQTQLDCTIVNQSPLIIGTADGLTGVTSVAGSVVVRADQIDITQAVGAAAGFVVITPRTPGRAVNLGGADTPTELGLSDAELDFVSASALIIGSSTTGTINVVAAISQPAGYSTLNLTTGGAIASNAIGTIAVANLSAVANAGIDLPGLQVSNFAFSNLVAGNVTAANSGPLNLAPVFGAGTSRNDAGTVSVTANGALAIVQDIIGLGTITLTTNDAAGAGQDIYLGLNHSITTTGPASDIVLRSGDGVLFDLGSVVRAGRAIGISINFGNADGAGATADIRRAFIDAPTGGATVAGAATDDTFIVSASPTTPIAVDGAGGFDTLQFDAAGRSVTVTSNAILSGGLPALQPVTFADIDSLNFLNAADIVIPGTAGDDTFALVRGAGGVRVSLNGGPAIVVGDSPLTLDGLTGVNTVVLDFAGGSPIPAGGISFVNISRYIVVGTAGDDVVDLQRAGTIQFQFTGGPFIDLPGATFFEFDGLAGSDALRVRYAGGDPVPANGVVFDGGTGANDRLGVFGAGNTAFYNPSATTPGDGFVLVDLGTITFRNLTPVDITGMANVAVVFPNADDVVAVDNGFDFTNGGATPALRISGTSGGVPIETLALWNNTNVVIDTRTVDGDDAITINSATVGANANLAILTGVGADVVTVGAGGVLLTGQFTVASQAINVNGPVTSTAGGVTFTNGGILSFGTVAVSAQGAILQDGAGPVNIAGNATFDSAATITFVRAIRLGAGITATFNSTGAGILFAGTINGGGNVIANTGGLTTFGGAIGASQALASLATNNTGSTNISGGQVATTGNQSYGDPVVLGATTTITAANVTFAQTVNSDATPRSLRVTSPGVTTFGGAVGGTSALASLTSNGGGTTAVNGGLVRTTGLQDFVNAVTVPAGATQFASLGNGAITFRGTLIGPSNVTINTGGLTEFLGPVSLTSLTTDVPGTTDLNGGTVTTTGNQNYNDPVVLTSDSTIIAANVTFAQIVDSDNTPRSLLVTSPGVTTFGGAVGGSSPLAFLTTNGGGTTAVNGGLVRTTGAQNYVDAVTVPAGATQFVSTGGNAIAFNNTLTGPANVTINTAGQTVFLGTVSLASLTTDAAGETDLNGGTVTTSGDQIYNDPVELTINTTIFAANVTFVQTVNSDGTPRSLTVNSPGVTTFGGAVGQLSPLASLLTDPPGITLINGGFVTTVGPQTYGDAVGMPAGLTVFTASGAAGDISFNGPTTSLGTVLVANARNVSINNGFSAVMLLQANGSGTTSFNGPTTITGVPAIDITNTAISLNADVSATGSGATVWFKATVNGVAQAAGALLVGALQSPAAGRDGVLLLGGAGSFTLNRPNNDVGFITANIVGALNFLDANDLSIALAGVQSGIVTNNGAVTLTTGRNFIAGDRNNVPANPPVVINAGTGIVQVNPGQAAGAQVVLVYEVIAGSVTLGTVIVPAQMFNNAQPDQFIVRPSANVEIVVQGNRPSVIVPPLDFVNRDALSPFFNGITVPAVFTPNGTSAGIYTFPDAASPTGFQRQALRFFEIEQLVGFSATTIAFQTSANTFTVATRVQQLGQIIQTATTQGQPQPNPFVVSPSITNPFQPFGASRVTYGDVNGDGAADLIIGGGPNGPPLVTVIDGNRLAAGGSINLNDPSVFLAQFYAYNPQFPGGIFVAAGDVNGDGKAEIVTAPDIGGAPHVRILSVVFSPGQPGFGNGVTIYNNVTNYTPAPGGLPAEFFAYDPGFTGGVRVAVGDVDGDTKADVVTGAGVGGGPHVKVFSGANGQTIRSFFAYDPGFTGGIFVAAAQFNGDGRADILTGPGIGGGPHIKVFSGANPAVLLANFLAPANLAAPPPSLGNPNPLLGVGSVAFAFIDGDDQLDIVVGTSRGTQSRVLFFQADGSQINLLQPFIIPNFLTDGVNVAGSGS